MAELGNNTPKYEPIIKKEGEDNSLMYSVLKLCSGLRSNGFDKQASKIENKFVAYAQSVHMYRTHKETGDDLVEEAHPDGDNKIVQEVSDNLGDVETIVSKHKKIVDTIQKEPTGKLAQYVAQCKIALAESLQRQIEFAANSARHNLTEAFSIVEGAGNMTDYILFGNMKYVRAYYVGFMKLLQSDNLTVSMIDDPLTGASMYVDQFESKVKPSMSGGVQEDVWSKVEPFIKATKESLATLKKLITQKYVGQAGEASGGELPETEDNSTLPTVGGAVLEKVNGEIGQAQSILQSIDKFSAKANDQQKKSFIEKVKGSVQAYIADLQSVAKNLSSVSQVDLNKFNLILGNIQRFANIQTYAEFKDAIVAYHTKLGQLFKYMGGW